MRLIIIITIIFASVLSSSAIALTLFVPDSVKSELKTVKIENDGREYYFRVKLPANFSPQKKYPVFLGIAGGNASEKIVNYCYYTMFRSDFLSDYFIYLPVLSGESSLRTIDSSKIVRILSAISTNPSVVDSGWIAGGASDGGVAAFNFARALPDYFRGIIALPGAIDGEPPKDWGDYRVMLAVGENDSPEWHIASRQTESALAGKVDEIVKYEMKRQNHIVSPEYNIDLIYHLFFDPDTFIDEKIEEDASK